MRVTWSRVNFDVFAKGLLLFAGSLAARLDPLRIETIVRRSKSILARNILVDSSPARSPHDGSLLANFGRRLTHRLQKTRHLLAGGGSDAHASFAARIQRGIAHLDASAVHCVDEGRCDHAGPLAGIFARFPADPNQNKVRGTRPEAQIQFRT